MIAMDNGYELKVTLSESLEKFIELCSRGRNSELPPGIRSSSEKGYVKVEDIKWLLANRKPGSWLHESISSGDVALPEPIIAPRNPELEARCQRLKAQQAEREYKKMTKNVDPVRAHHPEDTISHQVKVINRQLIAVFQFVVSVLAGFTFGFYGIQLLTGDLDFGFRLLLGVIFSLIIALAEIYFLAKKLADDMEFSDFPKAKVD